MRHALPALTYMEKASDPRVFRFCAIPQLMAAATLALCYDNYGVFEGVVKMRRGETAVVLLRTRTMEDVYLGFARFAREIASKVTASLGGRGLFGVELFVKGDKLWFSEVSPRPHDTGMVTLCTQAQNEFELHARAILGLPVDVSLRAPGASAVIYGGIEGRGIRFAGIDDALAVPQSDLRLFGKPESYRKRRMGVALANGPDIDVARSRAKECAGRVRPCT